MFGLYCEVSSVHRTEGNSSVCQKESGEKGAFWTKKRKVLILTDYLGVILNSPHIYKQDSIQPFSLPQKLSNFQKDCSKNSSKPASLRTAIWIMKDKQSIPNSISYEKLLNGVQPDREPFINFQIANIPKLLRSHRLTAPLDCHHSCDEKPAEFGERTLPAPSSPQHSVLHGSALRNVTNVCRWTLPDSLHLEGHAEIF